MSIVDTITKRCVQTAVYWGNPQHDVYSNLTFDEPIEVKCRWENRTVLLTSAKGEVAGSRAGVFVLQDMDEEGYLYLGTLDDLDSAQCDDPKLVDGAFSIKQFEKVPVLGSTTDFIRRAFLTEIYFGGR